MFLLRDGHTPAAGPASGVPKDKMGTGSQGPLKGVQGGGRAHRPTRRGVCVSMSVTPLLPMG